MKYIVILIIIFSIVRSYAGTIDPNTLDSKYIEYGSTRQFECVGRLCGKEEDGKLFCASAVAIKPKWILTAAHVIEHSKTCKLIIKDQHLGIKKIIPHKNFEYNNFGEFDIALCEVDGVIAIDNYPDLYLNTDEVGKECSMSGYGLNGTFLTGCKKSDILKRAGTNRIDNIEKHLLICRPSIENKTSLEYIIASGDSGGGLFIDGKLAGINSCVMALDKVPDSTYGDEGGHTRICMFVDWIQETTR